MELYSFSKTRDYVPALSYVFSLQAWSPRSPDAPGRWKSSNPPHVEAKFNQFLQKHFAVTRPHVELWIYAIKTV